VLLSVLIYQGAHSFSIKILLKRILNKQPCFGKIIFEENRSLDIFKIICIICKMQRKGTIERECAILVVQNSVYSTEGGGTVLNKKGALYKRHNKKEVK